VKRIRVLVIEDSLTARRRLVEALEADPALQVVGEARDGREGVDLCERLRPDVVTCDMMMPVMTGVSAVERIMAYRPTPILVVSASTNRGELFRTYDALAAGAIDVLEKPRADEPHEAWDERFRATVKLVSRIKVITHPRARLAAARGETLPRAPVPSPTTAPPSAHAPCAGAAGERSGEGAPDAAYGRVVAIGGSTGSPAAIVEILRGLPRAFPAPVLLVIHIDEPFGAAFAEWLDGMSPLPVRYAQDREALSALRRSAVLMAPPGRHLVLDRDRLRLDDGPERHSCKPSVDVLFESVARHAGARAVACLLTGMGRDGAAGLLAIRAAGGVTIAQDEASSVIFGMPREAIRVGAAMQVLPFQEIAAALVAATQAAGRPA
jgi:two-component system chemotaxis response regulator CheB